MLSSQRVLPILILVAVLLILRGSAVGSSDFGNNNPSASPFYYTEINYNPESGEVSSEIDEFSDVSDSASVVACSSLYDGGCLVSSHALLCNGGDDSNSAAASLMNVFDTDFSEEDQSEEEDDDDDDDEDDGHSSMLSTASLRRSKALADGSSVGGHSDDSSSNVITDESSSTASYIEGEVNLNCQPTGHSACLLKVRGGAVTSVADNELAKKLIVAAIVTLIYEAVMGHALEFLKIVMQTSPAGTTYTQAMKEITSEKGILGLWDGFVPWGVIQSVLKGGVFGLAHASASKVFVPLAEDGIIPMKLAMTLAGGIAGGFQGLVLSPCLLLKTRVMTNPIFRENLSMWKTTWLSFCTGAEVVKNEGFHTLMKGADIFSTKRVFDWSTRYFFSDMFESLFLKMKGSSLSTVERSTASFLGGVASTIVTLPLDVLVAQAQDQKKAGVKVSALQMFRDELKQDGWTGLRNKYMQGFEVRLLHVCLTTVVLKTGAPIVYDMIFGKSS